MIQLHICRKVSSLMFIGSCMTRGLLFISGDQILLGPKKSTKYPFWFAGEQFLLFNYSHLLQTDIFQFKSVSHMHPYQVLLYNFVPKIVIFSFSAFLIEKHKKTDSEGASSVWLSLKTFQWCLTHSEVCHCCHRCQAVNLRQLRDKSPAGNEMWRNELLVKTSDYPVVIPVNRVHYLTGLTIYALVDEKH